MRHLFRPAAIARLIITSLAAALLAPVLVAAPASAVVTDCNTGGASLAFNEGTMVFLQDVGGGASNGTAVGDRMLYPSATALCGGLDAVVTVKTLSGATISSIDGSNPSSTSRATNDPTYFAPNLASIGGSDKYAEFQFDFYVAGQIPASAGGTIPAGVTPITLYNVMVTTIDIDSRQFNLFSNVQGYTVSTSPASNLGITRYVPGTNTATTSWPADVLASATSNTNGANIAEDQITVNYATLNAGFTVRVGAYSDTNLNVAYFGILFGPANWQGATTGSTGYNGTSVQLLYNGNGSTGGTLPDSSTAQPSDTTTVGVQGTLVRTGYTFSGWNTKADGTGTPYAGGDTFTYPAADTTLYAQWTADGGPAPTTYTVTYNGNGNTGGTAPTDGSSPYTSGDTVTILGNSGPLTRTSYRFMGWNTASDGTGTNYSPGDTFNIVANTTLYAKWQLVANVYYLGNGNTGGSNPSDTNTYVCPETVTLLGAGTLTRTGYTFAGWNTQANGSGIAGAAGGTFSMPCANRTYYAQWTPNGVVVTYSPGAGSGTLSGGDTVTVNYGDTHTVRASTGYSKTGYHFTGWLSSTPYSPGDSVTITLPKTFTAQWAPNSYTLTTNTNGSGGVTSGGTFNYGDTTTLTATPAAGWHFLGWTGDCDGSSNPLVVTITANMNCTANFGANPIVTYKLTVTTVGDGTATPGTNWYNDGAKATVKAVPAVGWFFTGWSGACTGTALTCDVMMTMDKFVTATFVKGVTINTNTPGGGSVNSSQPTGTPLLPGTKVTLTATPNDGWEFTGWSGSCSGMENPLTVTLDVSKSCTANFKEKPKAADPIEVKDDTYKTGPNEPLKLPAGASIMKNDGTTITKVALATKTKHGTISLAPNGKLIYKPNKGFVGVDTFKYKAFDANGRSVIATVKIVVAPPKPKDIKTGR